jgi:peroxiredoxin
VGLVSTLRRVLNFPVNNDTLIGEEGKMALIETGAQAPAFSLPNQDGSNVSLADHAGKYVLLWWYPKADTPG